MKKRILCLIALLGLGMQAHATVITFVPSDSNTSIGNSVSVDIVISDLGDDDFSTAEIEGILSTFDLSIFFDDTIIQFDSFEFGTDCFGFTCLDVLGFDFNILGAFDLGGQIDVFEISFDDDLDLDFFQPNDFVLGTFTFTGLEIGVSALDIVVNELGGGFDEFGFAASLDADVVSGSIEVPEPGTLLLLMSGLLGLRMARPKKAIRA